METAPNQHGFGESEQQWIYNIPNTSQQSFTVANDEKANQPQ